MPVRSTGTQSLRDEIVCMAVLADARPEIGAKLRERGFVKPTSIPTQKSGGVVVVGDLGPLVRQRVGQLSPVTPRIWAHTTPHMEGESIRERSREICMLDGVRVAFSKIPIEGAGTALVTILGAEQGDAVAEIPVQATYRDFLYITGSVQALLSVFDRLISAWRSADFNPDGVTADLQTAIEFLRSPDAVRLFGSDK